MKPFNWEEGLPVREKEIQKSGKGLSTEWCVKNQENQIHAWHIFRAVYKPQSSPCKIRQ